MKSVVADQKIRVQSHNVSLGEALPDHSRDKIKDLCGRYFDALTDCTVHFKMEGANYTATISLKMGGLPSMSGHHSSPDIYLALKGAIDKLDHQLKRKKSQLREDKPHRIDKELPATTVVDLTRRKAPIIDPEPQPPEADEYTRALIQKSRQDADQLERETEMAHFQAQGLPIAAE